MIRSAFVRRFAAMLLLPWPGGALGAACTTPPIGISHGGAVSPNTNPNTLIFLDKTEYPAALCNDGSSPGFILRAGLGASASRFVIHLQEGGECSDAATCAARSPLLTGSGAYGTPGQVNQPAVDDVMWGATAIGAINARNNTGLLSPNEIYNPDFWDATTVEVLYCSSDYDSGAHAATGGFSRIDPATWNFQGRAILQAVIATLNAGYGLANATEILFSGSSAGGVGAFVNINGITATIPPSARFVAMADAGFFDSTFGAFDPASAAPPYVSAADPTLTQATFVSAIQIWAGSGDPLCAAGATTTTQQVQCYDTNYLTHGFYIAPPIFIAQSIYDGWQLVFNNVLPPYSDETIAYVTAFGANLDTDLVSIPAPASAGIATGPYHTLMDNAQFTRLSFPAAGGATQTLASLFGEWYRAPCSQVIATQIAGP